MEVCFINAPITGCTAAPEGICMPFMGGNCSTHANHCDCLRFDPSIPTITACAFQGTMCDGTEAPTFAAGCWGCFVVPNGGSSDGGDGG